MDLREISEYPGRTGQNRQMKNEILICCSREEKARAESICRTLQNVGYRMRFYSGVEEEPQGEQTVYLFFLSDKFFRNHNRRACFNNAVMNQSKRVLVLLEDFPVLPSLRLQMEDTPVYRASDYDNEEILGQAIESNTIFLSCLVRAGENPVFHKDEESGIPSGNRNLLESETPESSLADEITYPEESDIKSANPKNSLEKYLKSHLFSADEIFEKMQPVFAELQSLHEKKQIHGSICPDHLLLQEDGTLKLMDAEECRQTDLQETGSLSVKGRSCYQPPEDFFPGAEKGPRGDIYSLCASIYKCITGITPQDARDRTVHDAMKWPSTLQLPINETQEQVLKKGLAVKPENRFSSVREMQEKLQKGGKKKKSRLYFLVAAAALVIAAVLFFILYPWEIKEPEKLYHITVTPPQDLTVSDSLKAEEMLEERVALFAGDEKYTIEKTEDAIELYLPENLFAGKTVDRVFRTLLTSPTELYLFADWKKEGLPVDYSFLEEKTIPVAREDLASVSLRNGRLAENDTEEQAYLEIVLTDDFAETVKEKVDYWGERLSVALDLGAEEQTTFDRVSSKDGKTFYIIPDAEEENIRFLELIAYNLNREPLPKAMSFKPDYTTIISWESGEEENAGKNQCRSEEIPNPSVILLLDGFFIDNPGQMLNAVLEAKNRMDALDIPYAFSLDEISSKGVAAVKCSPERMSEEMMKILFSDLMDISFGKLCYYINSYSSWLQTLGMESGPALELNLDAEEEDVKEMFEQLEKEAETQKIYLRVNGIPVLWAKKKDVDENGKIVFSGNCFTETDLTDQDQWLLALLQRVLLSKQNYTGGFEVTGYQVISDENLSDSLQKGRELLGYPYRKIDDFCRAVEKLGKGITCSVPGYESVFKESIFVFLHLKPGEGFLDESLSLIKEVCEQVEFPSFPYRILFFLIDEKNNNQRARVSLYWSDSFYGKEGSLSMTVTFYGDGLDSYQEELKNRMLEDPFFAGPAQEGMFYFKP